MNDRTGNFSNSQKKAFARAFLKAIMLDDQPLGQDEMNHLYRIFSRLWIGADDRQEVVYQATIEPQNITDKSSALIEDMAIKKQLLLEIFSYLDTSPRRKVIFEDIRKEFSDAQISSLQMEGQRRNRIFRSFKETEGDMREKYDNSNADQTEISDDDFWSKIKGVAKKVSKKTLRLILVLWYCFRDPKTPLKIKAALAAPLLYFINPIDAIPDFILPVGLTDDAGVIAAAVSLFAFYLKKHHYRQSDETLKEWFGEEYGKSDNHNDSGSNDETIQEIGRIFSYADIDRKAFEEKRRSETNHLMRIAFDRIIDQLRHTADDHRIVS